MFAGISCSDLKLADFQQKTMLQDQKSVAEKELGKTSADVSTDDIIKIGSENKDEYSIINGIFKGKNSECSEEFDERDANKDGQVTISEIAEYYSAMREKLGILSLLDIGTNIDKEVESLKDGEKTEKEKKAEDEAKKAAEPTKENSDGKEIQEKDTDNSVKDEHTEKNFDVPEIKKENKSAKTGTETEFKDTLKESTMKTDRKEFISKNKDKIANLDAPTYRNGLKSYIMSNLEQKPTSFVEKTA